MWEKSHDTTAEPAERSQSNYGLKMYALTDTERPQQPCIMVSARYVENVR
jgi:hypothetical protein